MIDNQTKLYMSVSSRPGNFGASIFNELFRRHEFNAIYVPRRSKTPAEVIAALRTFDVCGCAISSPLKTEMIAHLDELDPVAEECNSINTIVNRDGRLHGFNTDVYGVQMALMNCGLKRALIYGSGSVVNSVIAALKISEFADISVTARHKSKADMLASEHGVKSGQNSYELLINATPASLDPANRELFDLSMNARAVFDLVVAPTDTALIARAKSSNLHTINGVDMSKWQLQKQFELYTGNRVDISEIDAIVGRVFR